MSQPEILPESAPDKASEAYIRIHGVTKKFDAITAVDRVDLNIRKGEIFALLGASGCGKTTLLRLLAGFEIPTDGQITIDGEDMQSIQPYNRPVNMMFQSYALFPHMTVAENMTFGMEVGVVFSVGLLIARRWPRCVGTTLVGFSLADGRRRGRG